MVRLFSQIENSNQELLTPIESLENEEEDTNENNSSSSSESDEDVDDFSQLMLKLARIRTFEIFIIYNKY